MQVLAYLPAVPGQARGLGPLSHYLGQRPPPTLQVSLWPKALEEHAQLHSLTLVMIILINGAGNLSIVNFELVICPLQHQQLLL